MLKFILLSLCLVSLLCRGLTLSIDFTGNELNDLDSNSTLDDSLAQPQYAALFINNKVFYVVLIRLNWHSAAEYCSSQNLVLASIDTEEDSESLLNKLRDNRLIYKGVRFWVGGSDQGHFGSYAWLGNGRPFSYTNWSPGQPDNSYGREHCVELLDDGQWNDIPCDASNFVICENRCSLNSYDVPTYTSYR